MITIVRIRLFLSSTIKWIRDTTGLILIVFGSQYSAIAQLKYTGFEELPDEVVFSQQDSTASWKGQGFEVPWVEGFNQHRAHIDNAFAKEGKNSLRIFYPKNNFGTKHTGAQAPIKLEPAQQYYISYWLRFSENFSWGTTSEGGKLPGLAAGDRCSGCVVCNGSNGFTTRLMWRAGGKLVLYLYHMDKANLCGDDHPLQLSPGQDFYAKRGEWIKITERVKINTANNHDGEVEVWVNDEPAIFKKDIKFVTNGSLIDYFYFSTFHGGNDPGWSPKVDSYIWFDEIWISTSRADIFKKWIDEIDFSTNPGDIIQQKINK